MDFINYDNEDNDTSSGREKGSSKDRVLEFFYRKRYQSKLMRTYYSGIIDDKIISNSVKVKRNVVSKMTTISELKENGIPYIEVDPDTEEFDFDKYDYYIVRSSRKKGIAPKDIKIENRLKSGLSKLSSLSAKGLERRIDDSKSLVDNTQKQLRQVKINLQYPVLHREDLSKMYHNIRENINDLKYEYEILKGETNNRSYAFEEAIKIMDKVDKYDEKGITTIEDMLKVAKNELSKLSVNASIKKKQDKIEENSNKQLGLKKDTVDINLYNNPNNFDAKIGDDKARQQHYVNQVVVENIVAKTNDEDKEKELEKENKIDPDSIDQIKPMEEDSKEIKIPNEPVSDDKEEVKEKEEPVVVLKLPKEDIYNKKKLQELQLDIVTLKSYEEKIAYELKRQKEIIDKMYRKVGNVSKEYNKSYEVTGYGRMLSSFGNIAVGMLTLPLTPLRMFNLNLGASLINKGVKNLSKGLDTKEKISINYKYEDLTQQINDVQDSLDNVQFLIADSIDELIVLKQKFIKEFSSYEYQIPDYYKTLKNFDILSKRLENNQTKLNNLDKNLKKEKEQNKVMIKKIENQEY